ncbi:MAG: tripeptide aminopeptidase PepT [Thermoplasmatota archaeon]
MADVLNRFLRYVRIDTQSKEGVEDSYPSTEKQKDLLGLLVEELKALGLEDAEMDEYGYVMATLPSNIPEDHPARGKIPVVGLISHVDTSPEVSGKDVKPIIHENYQGGDIVLPGDQNVVIKAEENPHLADNIGGTIITSDGTTLLGADDKAGVAEIMSALAVLREDPSILHGTVRIGFTPDEEVGNGTKFFDVEKFGADMAYTMDGGEVGEVEDECGPVSCAAWQPPNWEFEHRGYEPDELTCEDLTCTGCDGTESCTAP